jgi:hypothetical protein
MDDNFKNFIDKFKQDIIDLFIKKNEEESQIDYYEELINEKKVNQLVDIFDKQSLYIKPKYNIYDKEEVNILVTYFIYSVIYYYEVDGFEIIKENFNQVLNILDYDEEEIYVMMNNLYIR